MKIKCYWSFKAWLENTVWACEDWGLLYDTSSNCIFVCLVKRSLNHVPCHWAFRNVTVQRWTLVHGWPVFNKWKKWHWACERRSQNDLIQRLSSIDVNGFSISRMLVSLVAAQCLLTNSLHSLPWPSAWQEIWEYAKDIHVLTFIYFK